MATTVRSSAPGQAVLARIAAHDPLFDQLYTPAKRPIRCPAATRRRSTCATGRSQPQEYPVILIETQP
jgi:hypothetical protein